MNAFDSGLSPTRKARIEIIPLIDVIFFLLATFVLFTLSLQKIKMIEVPLPVVPPDNYVEKDTTVFIQASADGTFYWKQGRDGAAELITAPELPARLQNYVRSVPEPRVLVRSDRGAKFGAGVLVLDEVRRAGIKQVSVETITSQTGK
jgi:biopolymer transport protein ExbD